MKNITVSSILFAIFILFVSADIERDSIIDIKWKLKNPSGTTRAIFFRHDNTFWHYSDNGKFGVDSIMLCRWDMAGDRVYLSCGDTAVQSLHIIFCDGNNLTISDNKNKENIQYTK